MTILMGRDNPDGYKLEELLKKLQQEVVAKCEYIKGDPRIIAKQVLANNNQIIGLLFQAETLQRLSYDLLNTIGKNEGALGSYRIGTQRDDDK